MAKKDYTSYTPSGSDDSNVLALDVTSKQMDNVMKSFSAKMDGIVGPLRKLSAAGSGGGKSGSSSGISKALINIGNVQIGLQREMSMRLAQISINTASKWQKQQMAKQDKLLQSAKKSAMGIDIAGKKEGGGGLMDSIRGIFGRMRGMFGKLLGGFKKFWGGAKKADKAGGSKLGIGKMLGLGGVSIVGALVGKMISSSPLLQAIFKIMSTSMTLIMRPIGDFFGAFLRPMSIYFLKEVAIPFFQSGKGWMKMGEKYGKIAVGFFMDPIRSISSAITLATEKWEIFGFKLNSADKIKKAKEWQEDPGAVRRQELGINEAMFGGFGSAAAADLASTISTGDEAMDDYVATVDAGTEAQEKINDTVNDTVVVLDDFNKTIETETIYFDDVITNTTNTMEEKFNENNRRFGDAAGHYNTKIEEAGDDIGKAGKTIFDHIADAWESTVDWFGNLLGGSESTVTIATMGLKNAYAEQVDTIKNANEKTREMANLATGGLFETKKGLPTTNISAGAAGDPNDILGAGYSAVAASGGLDYLDGKKVTGIGSVMSQAQAAKVALQQTGGSALGDIAGNKFESSPGNFVDIYNKGVKVEPGSAEGKVIQGIYNDQLQNKIRNNAQTEHVNKVKAFTKADETRAYVMAGGGEKGLEAAKYAKENNLDLHMYPDIIKLADKFGIDHNMVDTAREGYAKQVAMAEKIMKDRIAAGQTPSIQGDMLRWGFDVEDSDFGWSDARLAEQDAMYASIYQGYEQGDLEKQLRENSVQAADSRFGTGDLFGFTTPGPLIRDTSGLQPGDARVGSFDPSFGFAQGVFGSPTTNAAGGQNTGSGFGKTTVGGGNRGPGGSGPGGGTKGSTSGGTKGTGGGKGGTGGRKGGGGSGPGGGSKGGGTTSGSKGTGKKGKAGSGRRGQFGAIIDEPIIGTGMYSGSEWLLGESQNELVTPMSEVGNDGNYYSINIHVGNITKEADYQKLKPLIQRWILEASSRRGMV